MFRTLYGNSENDYATPSENIFLRAAMLDAVEAVTTPGAEAGIGYVQVLLRPERIAPAQLHLCIVGGAAGEKSIGTFQLCDMVHQASSFCFIAFFK
jgi:hypothetical protein